MAKVSDEETLYRLSYHLRQFRGTTSLSEIARRAGTYPAAIKRIEDGESMPGVGLMTRVAKAVDRSVADFLAPVKKTRKTA